MNHNDLHGISRDPWSLPRSTKPEVRLDMVPPDLLHLRAQGDEVGLPGQYRWPYLLSAEARRIWQVRSAQIREAADAAPWITRVVMDPSIGRPVGMAGFHGPPDETGMVEVGYQIDPQQRRRGYARRALEILLAVAHDSPGVRVVRATISPDNVASLALVADYGFIRTGEQWDEEDGVEIVFEVTARM
jgi:ribosomal-protein-alanine N-acetyltransferase